MHARLIAVAVALALAFAAAAAAADPQLVRHGRALYDQGCITCHGSNGEGVAPGSAPAGSLDVHGAGPPLLGVGARAADFYLSTGYMPLRDPYAQPSRRRPLYSEDDIRALVAYIGSLGGPPVPRPHPERGSISEGLRLFTENCAGCHQVVAKGGIVTTAIAPGLDQASPTQIAEAVRIGPYVMPRFTQRQLSDRKLDSIIAYVQYAKDPVNRGGWAIGNIGPVPEGLIAWLLAGVVLLVLARVIGERA
jgi:ubiquinol-cytochrome c reductase cytochrome c subunit